MKRQKFPIKGFRKIVNKDFDDDCDLERELVLSDEQEESKELEIEQ